MLRRALSPWLIELPPLLCCWRGSIRGKAAALLRKSRCAL